jgi:hypothetical protein
MERIDRSDRSSCSFLCGGVIGTLQVICAVHILAMDHYGLYVGALIAENNSSLVQRCSPHV